MSFKETYLCFLDGNFSFIYEVSSKSFEQKLKIYLMFKFKRINMYTQLNNLFMFSKMEILILYTRCDQKVSRLKL